MELTAVILTFNEAKHVTACIESLDWADRVVVFDSCSRDDTVMLAQEAGAEIHQRHFNNYAEQRNSALDAVKSDWILFVDADERGTDELGEELRQVAQDCHEAGWYVPRHNYIFGRLTLGAGWYPDYQLRYFRYGTARYERPVHEVAVVDGSVGYLRSPLVHINYESVAQFHEKQRRYSAYDASILRAQGVRPKAYTRILQPVRHFWWRFITLKGYRDRWHGLRLSLLMAYYEWFKYRELAHLPQQPIQAAE